MRETVYVNEWLEKLSLSQTYLAEASGIELPNISRIAKCRRAFTSTRQKIEKALKMKPGDLLRSPLRGLDLADWLQDPNAALNGKPAAEDVKEIIRRLVNL